MADFAGFVQGTYSGRSVKFDSSRTVNFYVEKTESGTSRSVAVMYGTPGLRLWTNLPTGRVRGCIRFTDDVAIVVAGTGVWKLTPAAVATQIGSVPDTSPAVSMASNGTVVMMVDGPGGYFIDPMAATVTAIGGENFAGADRVDFVDGYFAFNKPDTGQFQITGLYTTAIDGADFATAEGGPDNITSLIVDHRELWLFGQNTTEVWYNSGDPDFPFARIQGAFLEVGCAAAMSVAKADNSIFWVARDDRGVGTVQRATGYSSQRVSNHAVEYAISQYARIDDAIAYTYSQEGHTFYVLTFPTADATWCFDISNGEWAERLYRNPTTAGFERHRSNCQMVFAGLTLVGDYENGNIYVLDLDTFTDNGAPLVSMRRAPHIAAGVRAMLFHSLEIVMQTGVGLPDGQGSDPKAMLRWSNDGGYSWSSEVWRSFGRIGERMARARWTRLGRARDRVFEVSISDPVRRVIVSADVEATECVS